MTNKQTLSTEEIEALCKVMGLKVGKNSDGKVMFTHNRVAVNDTRASATQTVGLQDTQMSSTTNYDTQLRMTWERYMKKVRGGGNMKELVSKPLSDEEIIAMLKVLRLGVSRQNNEYSIRFFHQAAIAKNKL